MYQLKRHSAVRLTIFSVALLGLYFAFSAFNTFAASDQDQAFAQSSSSSQDGVNFTIEIPTIEIAADGAVSAPGLTAMTDEAGAPALPFYSTLIALPPEAQPRVSVRELTASDERVRNVKPAASIANRDELLDGLYVTSIEADLGLTYEQNAAIYSADSLYPANLYEISEPMYVRDLRVVELKVFPIRYNPAQGMLTHVQALEVKVDFMGAKMSRSAETVQGAVNLVSDDNVLNLDVAKSWRALPASNAPSAQSSFPIGKDTFKIEVTRDGVYELTRSALAQAGMDVANVNPNTFEMMHRGQPVAYEFVGDSDNSFEVNESIRFYGWAWDGSAYESQYADSNIFWLWAGGNSDRIQSAGNPTGYTAVTTFPESIKYEQDNLWTATYTNKWPSFDNTEADTWYWDRFERGDSNQSIITRTYTLQTPNPASTGPDATFSAEVFSSRKHDNHRVHATLNGLSTVKVWDDINAVSITRDIPLSALNTSNTMELHADTVDNTGQPLLTDRFYTNSFHIDYTRLLKASNNELIFKYDTAGSRQFNVSGFSTNSAADMIVWNISDEMQPARIPIAGSDITGQAPAYTVRIGSQHGANAKFIATSKANLLTPASISEYVAPSIEPTGNGADWVAISHNTLKTQSIRLANHRAAQSNLTTHVIDVEDIYNQYGFGYAIPQSIQDYMRHAVADWSAKPQYLLLAGDATHNPLQKPCSVGCSDWSLTETTMVATDLLVEDRFLGLIPTDHTFSMVVGNDILPDISVGRIAARTSAEMANTVDKIIEYDNSIADGEAWTNDLLFLADNFDDGGNFCGENKLVKNNYVPQGFDSTDLCLDRYLYEHNSNDEIIRDSNNDPVPLLDSNGNPVTQSAAKDQMRAAFYSVMGTQSSGIVNYRGHGSIQDWAAGLISASNNAEWTNIGKPTVILSADCLDGNFAWPEREALSETFLGLDNVRASAGHWSSTGLGYSFEHTALHTEFYRGLYNSNLKTIGNAINYSKAQYVGNSSGDFSEVFAFTLQGDPAMNMPQLTTSYGIYLPVLTR